MTHDPTASPGVPEPSTSLDDDLEPADGADDLEGLMLRLRGIADQVDAPPPVVTDLARAAFETRDLDAELAVLTADSDVDTPALTRAGGTATASRMVSFESGEIGVELQIDHTGTGASLTGVVYGPATTAEIETVDRRTPLSLDRGGWFHVDIAPGDRVRLRVSTERGMVCTEWVLV